MGELEQAISDYLASVRARGGSPRTLGSYSDVLIKLFLPWAQAGGISSPRELNQQILDRFNSDLLERVSERTGRPLSRASVASYLGSLRAFLKWAERDGTLSNGLRVQYVRVPRKVLDTLSRAEMSEMESAASAERDKLIIRILSDAGLRLGELLALTPQNLVENGRDRYLSIQERTRGGGAKGRSARLVPITPAVYRRLKRFAEKGRPTDMVGNRIFISLRRRGSGLYEPLKAKAVVVMLQAVSETAGIRKPVNPHAFRHSMATNCLRAGMNPLVLQQILGHANLNQITNTYSHLVVGDISQALYRALADEPE